MDVSDISKTSQNNIPDAKYYLVRPKNSRMIFVMDKKPDYGEEPFYNSCKECKLDMNNYLESHCIDQFDSDYLSMEEDGYLHVLEIYPLDNSVAYVFGRPKEAEVDVFNTLTSIDTYSADEEVARYIQEHPNEFKVEESKAPSTLGPTKESKGTPVILNKRLLI